MSSEMLSLYDYLGQAAGPQLGKQVAEYAKIVKAKCETRFVSNPKYSGEVMLYTEEFLNDFFENTSGYRANRSKK